MRQAVIYRGTRHVATYARDLGNALGIRTVRALPSKWVERYREDHTVVNWGTTEQIYLGSGLVGRVINKPANVIMSINKLTTLTVLRLNGISVPRFTTDRDEAIAWSGGGADVIARTILRGSRGKGIVVVRPGYAMPNASLYTEYFNGSREYRVHVFSGNPEAHVSQKRRRNGSERTPIGLMIRNGGPYWVFCTNRVTTPPPAMVAACHGARSALGLDFAAFDCRAKRDGSFVILESNTAPGFEGSTLDWYETNVRRLLNAG